MSRPVGTYVSIDKLLFIRSYPRFYWTRCIACDGLRTAPGTTGPPFMDGDSYALSEADDLNTARPWREFPYSLRTPPLLHSLDASCHPGFVTISTIRRRFRTRPLHHTSYLAGHSAPLLAHFIKHMSDVSVDLCLLSLSYRSHLSP